ncbi:MAG: hypothetical protein M1822_008045 [Bathelium mastoideum]|nr:MAG: hypothetical protein M1822_008045 [Bathelium mastoideum]
MAPVLSYAALLAAIPAVFAAPTPVPTLEATPTLSFPRPLGTGNHHHHHHPSGVPSAQPPFPSSSASNEAEHFPIPFPTGGFPGIPFPTGGFPPPHHRGSSRSKQHLHQKKAVPEQQDPTSLPTPTGGFPTGFPSGFPSGIPFPTGGFPGIPFPTGGFFPGGGKPDAKRAEKPRPNHHHHHPSGAPLPTGGFLNGPVAAAAAQAEPAESREAPPVGPPHHHHHHNGTGIPPTPTAVSAASAPSETKHFFVYE